MSEIVKKKRGRPLGSTAENTASRVIQMRIEPDQLEAYKLAAERRGLPMSTWAKSILNKESKGKFYLIEFSNNEINQEHFIMEISKQPCVFWDWLTTKYSDSPIEPQHLENLSTIKVFVPFGLDLNYLQIASELTCKYSLEIQELDF